jgi:hypothetical protein
MYSQIGDAVGAMGKGQEIIPLQDERGFPIAQSLSSQSTQDLRRMESPDRERAPSRGSFTDSLGLKDKEKMDQRLRRASKRDSGILLPSSPLIAQLGQLGANHERSHSLPVMPPDNSAPTSAPLLTATLSEKAFDFERMEQNLARIEKMMDSNASQLRSLEHVQAANLERLTAALLSNAEMIKELGNGQERLGSACKELRKAVRDIHKEDRSERASLRSVGSMASVSSSAPLPPSTPLRNSTSIRDASPGERVKRGPRKLGQKVVGYVYAEAANGDGAQASVVPVVKTMEARA